MIQHLKKYKFSQASDINEFTSFQLKIVMKGTNFIILISITCLRITLRPYSFHVEVDIPFITIFN